MTKHKSIIPITKILEKHLVKFENGRGGYDLKWEFKHQQFLQLLEEFENILKVIYGNDDEARCGLENMSRAFSQLFFIEDGVEGLYFLYSIVVYAPESKFALCEDLLTDIQKALFMSSATTMTQRQRLLISCFTRCDFDYMKKKLSV